MSAKYSFYEVVNIKPERPSLSKIEGLSGTILGMAQNENGGWIYAVHIFDTDDSWDIREAEIVTTGKFMKREDFYSGESLIIDVDGKSGEGKLKD